MSSSRLSSSRSRRWSLQRIGPWLALLVLEVFLVVTVLAGFEAVQSQRIRHGDATVRVVATVTDTVRQCGKGGCTWTSLGRYELDGRVQEDVVLVEGSGSEQRGPQTMLVDPAHPRRAVNLHDHDTVWLVLAPIAALGFVVVNTLLVRRFRRRRRTTAGATSLRP